MNIINRSHWNKINDNLSKNYIIVREYFPWGKGKMYKYKNDYHNKDKIMFLEWLPYYKSETMRPLLLNRKQMYRFLKKYWRPSDYDGQRFYCEAMNSFFGIHTNT